MRQLSDTVTPQGIVAVCRQPRFNWDDVEDARLLVLTSHLPRPKSDGDRALRAIGGRGLFDAVEMFDDDGRARLAHYAGHGPDRPTVGFWSGQEIEQRFG